MLPRLTVIDRFYNRVGYVEARTGLMTTLGEIVKVGNRGVQVMMENGNHVWHSMGKNGLPFVSRRYVKSFELYAV